MAVGRCADTTIPPPTGHRRQGTSALCGTRRATWPCAEGLVAWQAGSCTGRGQEGTMKRSMPEAPEVTVQLVARGDISAGDREYARAKVAKVFGWIREPVPFARVKLARSANPAVSRPALAQA